MRAMVLEATGAELVELELPEPEPGDGQVLLDVSACGVCRTDLHVVDGELPDPKLPLCSGTRSSARWSAPDRERSRFSEGDRVGVPWLGWTCGDAATAARGARTSACGARFTGYRARRRLRGARRGGRALLLSDPGGYPDLQAAPLLCAGLIGYRSLRLAGDGERLGLYGFGASAHIICQVAVAQGRHVFALTREGDARVAEPGP